MTGSPVATGAALERGAAVGERYVVLDAISRGAMGAVYRGLDRESGEHVALKHLIDPTQAARFAIEARLLADLRHPRVVRVLGSTECELGSFLVMELVEGTDLGRLAESRGGRIEVDEALARVLEACEALAYVHGQHVVHRDVKPRNLIAGTDGVVVVDFGIARAVDTAIDGGTRAVGTPHFMAPEVFVGEAVSPRSDVYSLAATLWTLVSGTPPSYGERTSLSDAVPGVTGAIEHALRQGLELAPERRTASVEAFAASLGGPVDGAAGRTLGQTAGAGEHAALLEAVVHAAAGVFDAAAASVALTDEVTRELVYQAAWGASAREVVGVRLAPGTGLAGAALRSEDGIVVPDCRSDPRFAAQVAAGIGYVPNTMLIVPLRRDGVAVGVLQLLDRRDGGGYGAADLPRAALFADIVVASLPAGSAP